MGRRSTAVYRFGDLLALARQSWLVQMSEGLRAMGYPDYRRSDALALRLLRRGPMPIGRLGDALGVSRQAARKVADGLERRGFAIASRGSRDARQVNLSLTPQGAAYGQAIVTVIERLNRDLSNRIGPQDLAAVDTVLRSVLTDNHTRMLAAHIPAPGSDDGGHDPVP